VGPPPPETLPGKKKEPEFVYVDDSDTDVGSEEDPAAPFSRVKRNRYLQYHLSKAMTNFKRSRKARKQPKPIL
ncbi:unnamed protein product, partial [Symbiodinium pilosum]